VSLVQALKHRFRVFHKTDFHWTDPAAAYAAKELVDTLGKHAGLGPLWDQPIELATGTKIDGGEMRAMGLLWPRAEEGLLLEETGIRKPRGSLVAHTNANNWTFAVDEPSEPKLLPPTVIFGDSFADALDRAGWLVYFRRLQKFYNWDVGKRYHEIPQDTRFVILQFSDGHLNAFANDEFWPAEIAMPGLPAPAGSASGALAANPNPVLLCNETGVGATTVAWTTRGTRTTEIHLGSPSGPMWVRGGSSGSAKTGQWVGKGMTFYLQDVTDNAPLDSNHTLASLKIDVAGGGACP